MGACRMRGPHGAGWSSLAARRAHNPKVAGSNPAPATNFPYDSKQSCWLDAETGIKPVFLHLQVDPSAEQLPQQRPRFQRRLRVAVESGGDLLTEQRGSPGRMRSTFADCFAPAELPACISSRRIASARSMAACRSAGVMSGSPCFSRSRSRSRRAVTSCSSRGALVTRACIARVCLASSSFISFAMMATRRGSRRSRRTGSRMVCSRSSRRARTPLPQIRPPTYPEQEYSCAFDHVVRPAGRAAQEPTAAEQIGAILKRMHQLVPSLPPDQQRALAAAMEKSFAAPEGLEGLQTNPALPR